MFKRGVNFFIWIFYAMSCLISWKVQAEISLADLNQKISGPSWAKVFLSSSNLSLEGRPPWWIPSPSNTNTKQNHRNNLKNTVQDFTKEYTLPNKFFNIYTNYHSLLPLKTPLKIYTLKNTVAKKVPFCINSKLK